MFNSANELVAGEAPYYGHCCTHNKAEAMACRALYAKLGELVESGDTVIVVGDLALVLGFLTGINKQSKALLMAIIKEMRSLARCA